MIGKAELVAYLFLFCSCATALDRPCAVTIAEQQVLDLALSHQVATYKDEPISIAAFSIEVAPDTVRLVLRETSPTNVDEILMRQNGNETDIRCWADRHKYQLIEVSREIAEKLPYAEARRLLPDKPSILLGFSRPAISAAATEASILAVRISLRRGEQGKTIFHILDPTLLRFRRSGVDWLVEASYTFVPD